MPRVSKNKKRKKVVYTPTIFGLGLALFLGIILGVSVVLLIQKKGKEETNLNYLNKITTHILPVNKKIINQNQNKNLNQDKNLNQNLNQNANLNKNLNKSQKTSLISSKGNIIISEPQANSTVSSPIKISGKGRAFEGTLYISVKSKEGIEIIKESISLPSGDPTKLKAFTAYIPYDFDYTQEGYLEIYSISPKDGSVQDLVRIPVRFK
jgi:hypothetical protein